MDAEYHTTLRDMLRRYRLTAVYAFGSRAAEIAARVAGVPTQAGGAPSADHPLSDVDIGVQPTHGTRLSAEQRVRLILELEDLFAVTPGTMRAVTIAQKAARVQAMLRGIEGLRLADFAAFEADPRSAAAAESYLRRALEALLDLGRHILAKGLGQGPAEYKEVALALTLSTEAGSCVADPGLFVWAPPPVRHPPHVPQGFAASWT